MLFNKGNVRTPFLSMIGGKTKYTNSVEFILGQEYAGFPSFCDFLIMNNNKIKQ